MCTLTLDIPHNVIKSLLICAGDRDVRYYLNGICLDMRTPGRTHLIATDGHRALIVDAADMFARDDDGQPVSWREIGAHYVIPREVLENVKPLKVGKRHDMIRLEVSRAPAAPVMVTVSGITSASVPAVDCKYPEVSLILPATVSLEAGQYSPAYIGDFGRVSALLKGKGKSNYITLSQNGTGPALVEFGIGAIRAFGVVMPCRTDAPAIMPPPWFTLPAADAPAAEVAA